MESEWITKVVTIHPKWGINVCTKFHPLGISLKTTNVNLVVALE